MTAIAGVVHRGRVWLAGEARISDGDTAISGPPKVWCAAGVVLGGAGDCAVDRVLRAVRWPTVVCADSLADEIDRAATALGVTPIEALIGAGGQLWQYAERSVWAVPERYAAIGSGAPVCLGYLAASHGIPPQERVRGAISAAIAHVPSCGGKITVVSTPPKR